MNTRKKQNNIRARRKMKTVDNHQREFKPQVGLTNEEELALSKEARTGNLGALDEIIHAHIRLVDVMAAKYQGQGLSQDELKYVGNIGLMKAAHRFDEEKGVNFKSYAIWWIRQSMLKALHEQARINLIPRELTNGLHKNNAAFGSMEQRRKTEPTDKQLNDHLRANENGEQHDSGPFNRA